jgi:hypothetical protein
MNSSGPLIDPTEEHSDICRHPTYGSLHFARIIWFFVPPPREALLILCAVPTPHPTPAGHLTTFLPDGAAHAPCTRENRVDRHGSTVQTRTQ